MADNILETIAEYTRSRIEEAKKKCPPAALRRVAEGDRKIEVPDFREALSVEGISFICECKKASPSKGVIAEDFPYIDIAKEYEEAGAAAISVLTEPKWFMGENRYLQEIADTVSIPCLRKDFVVDSYMIYEAKTLGASSVLFITAILEKEQLGEYLEIAHSLGLSALVETHDEWEVEKALGAGAKILGVNNRNLKDFTVDLQNSVRLRKEVPDSVLFVAESGIRSEEDVRMLEKAGVDGILVGEALMKHPDKKDFLERLRGRGSL